LVRSSGCGWVLGPVACRGGWWVGWRVAALGVPHQEEEPTRWLCWRDREPCNRPLTSPSRSICPPHWLSAAPLWSWLVAFASTCSSILDARLMARRTSGAVFARRISGSRHHNWIGSRRVAVVWWGAGRWPRFGPPEVVPATGHCRQRVPAAARLWSFAKTPRSPSQVVRRDPDSGRRVPVRAVGSDWGR